MQESSANPEVPAGPVGRMPRKPAPMPRWVKVSIIVGVLLVVLVVVMLLTGHGPGRHLSSGAAAASIAAIVGVPGSWY